MNIECIEYNIFKLNFNGSNEYTHHRLEYDDKILDLLNKKHVSYDTKGYMFHHEYIFKILNDKPTKIKIIVNCDKNDVEYIYINRRNKFCLIL